MDKFFGINFTNSLKYVQYYQNKSKSGIFGMTLVKTMDKAPEMKVTDFTRALDYVSQEYT